MRFTCTSIGDRKMLICCHLPAGPPCPAGAPATITRPSAGDTTASASFVIARSGSRKKNRKKQASTRKMAAPPAPKNQSARMARINEPPMNGQPAGSMRMCVRGGSSDPPEGVQTPDWGATSGGAMLARVLADHRFHLVLQRELLLF